MRQCDLRFFERLTSIDQCLKEETRKKKGILETKSETDQVMLSHAVRYIHEDRYNPIVKFSHNGLSLIELARATSVV